MVLSKILQLFFSPLPLSLLFILLGWFLLKNRTSLARKFFWVGISLLLIFSNRGVANLLVLNIESKFPNKALTEYPAADAIIVLGGSLGSAMAKGDKLEENAGSRLVPAFQLFQLKKSRFILVSGGNPYTRFDGLRRTEADDMASFLENLGVPASVILKEDRSRNTEENAREVLKEVQAKGWKQLLLVTSAFHMRRAEYLFRKFGMEVIPVPVAQKAGVDLRQWYSYMIPNAFALELSAIAVKEYLGYLWAMVKT